jgi:hypothetical protein
VKILVCRDNYTLGHKQIGDSTLGKKGLNFDTICLVGMAKLFFVNNHSKSEDGGIDIAQGFCYQPKQR